MTDDTDRTTMTAPGRVRDRVKENRKVDEEPLWKVIDRALDALEGNPTTEDVPALDIEAMLAEYDGVEYEDLVAACREALRDELAAEALQ